MMITKTLWNYISQGFVYLFIANFSFLWNWRK